MTLDPRAEIAATDEPVAASRGRRVVLTLAGVVVLAVLLYGLLPRVHGVQEAYREARHASGWWMSAAIGFELLSFAGYAALFRVVFGDGGRIDAAAAWLISLAGVAATRLLASGGAGGIALTAWAVRRSGQDARETTVNITAFLLVLYAVYMAALVVFGGGLLLGVLPGDAPVALTLTGVVLGVTAFVVIPLLGLVPRRHRPDDPPRSGWRARLGEVLDGIPGGVRRALRLAGRHDPLLLGAVAWWAFDIAALWAALEAFGASLPVAPLVVAYFIGMLGNLLPLPGGIGGVEGGIIGALIACGVDPGTAVVAVLAYRLASLWLPTVCGLVAYPMLLRRVHGWGP